MSPSPRELRVLTKVPPLPPRPADGHKGTFGRVLIVGGSEDMLGAPVLAGTAALRLGSGLVQVAIPRVMLPAALSITPELVGMGLDRGSEAKLIDAAGRADAVVIGPGLGQSPAARRRLSRLLRLDKPTVIDADALNLLAALPRWPAWINARAILTPHPGEMARLTRHLKIKDVPADPEGRVALAVHAARTFGQVVLLKGHRSVITDGRHVYINTTGDDTLAKAGSGDVLSGILGSLLGQGLSPLDAAILGAHLHGRAGELAGRKLGRRSALSRDVIDAIPLAMKRL